MTNTERNTFRNDLEARLAEIRDGGANREALAIDTDRDYAVSNLERDADRLRELRAAWSASTPVLSASASAASSASEFAIVGRPDTDDGGRRAASSSPKRFPPDAIITFIRKRPTRLFPSM